MTHGIKLDRYDGSKLQDKDGLPNGSTRGNVYIDSLTGILYTKSPAGWEIVDSKLWTRTSGNLTPYTTGEGLDIQATGISKVSIISPTTTINSTTIDLTATTTINLDATTAINLDSIESSYFKVTGNSVTDQTLELTCTNASAGEAAISLLATDNIESNCGTLFSVISPTTTVASTTINLGADADINLTATTVINLDSIESSYFKVTGNSVTDQTLELTCTNAGAGEAAISLLATDNIESNCGTLFSVISPTTTVASTTINLGADADINLTATTDINLTATTTIDLAATTAINIDATTAVNIDAVSTSYFKVTGNSASQQKVELRCTNAGAGLGSILLTSDDNIESICGVGFYVTSPTTYISSTTARLTTTSTINIVTTAGGAINIGATNAVNIDATTAINIDATTAVNIDAVSTSYFKVTGNSASEQTLELTCTNAGAGDGTISLLATDNIESNCGTLFSIISPTTTVASTTINLGADADINLTATTDINLTATTTIDLTATTAINLDATTAINLDSIESSYFKVTGNSVTDQTLELTCTNASAGEAAISLLATDNIESNCGTLFSVISPTTTVASTTINLDGTTVNIDGTTLNLDITGLTIGASATPGLTYEGTSLIYGITVIDGIVTAVSENPA